MQIKDWLSASRLRTLPLAAACVFVGAAIALASGLSTPEAEERFWMVFGGVLLTVLVLQVLSNWANDVGDFENGADGKDRLDRAVASGRISSHQMRRGVILASAMAFILGVSTVIFALHGTGLLWASSLIVLLGLSGIAAAYCYTAGNRPYGYAGWGDAAVFLFFGWIGVGGTAFLLAHSWSWTWLLPGTLTGGLSVAVLNLNNMRDHLTDAAAGKKTLPVRYGWLWSKWYHTVVFVVAWGSWWIFALYLEAGQWRGMMWILCLSLVHAGHVLRVHRTLRPADLDPELKKVAISTAVVAFFLLLAQTQLPDL